MTLVGGDTAMAPLVVALPGCTLAGSWHLSATSHCQPVFGKHTVQSLQRLSCQPATDGVCW